MAKSKPDGLLFRTTADRDIFNGRKHPTRPMTPSIVGSRGDDETCGTCGHLRRIPYHGKTYIKCGLMEHH